MHRENTDSELRKTSAYLQSFLRLTGKYPDLEIQMGYYRSELCYIRTSRWLCYNPL